GLFPVGPATPSTPSAHSSALLGVAPLPITQSFSDVRGTYTGPWSSPVTGRTDQMSLQIEQQVSNGRFQPVSLPNRRGVPLKRIQQQLGNNFRWAALPDGRLVPAGWPQGQAGNNFQGTLTIAGLGMTFTVIGTFGRHGQVRAAGVDGQHILTL